MGKAFRREASEGMGGHGGSAGTLKSGRTILCVQVAMSRRREDSGFFCFVSFYQVTQRKADLGV